MSKDYLHQQRRRFLRSKLIRGATGSLVIKVFSIFISLLMSVVLARVLGIENFGIYTFCLSLTQLLTVPAMLGGHQLLVREVALYKSTGSFHFLHGLLLQFRKASLWTSLFLAITGSLVGYYVYRDSTTLTAFFIAMALIPLLAAIQLQGAAIRGLKHILLGQVAITLRPVFVLLLVWVTFALTGKALTAEIALIAQLISSLLLVILTYIVLNRLTRDEIKDVKPQYETSKWIKSILPLILATGMQTFHNESSVIILGLLQNPEEVSLYRVAQRGAVLVSFGLIAVNMTIAPTVSELFSSGKKDRLQQLLTKSALASLFFSLPVVLLIILGGKQLIPFIFGVDYTPAYIPMIIICFGHLVNVFMGSVAVVLNMVGLEKITARGVTIAAISSVVLNVILIPFFGTIGASIASAGSMVIFNVLLAIWLYKKTGIITAVRWIKA